MGIWWGMLSGPIPAGHWRVTGGNGSHTPKTKRIARSRGKPVVICDRTGSIPRPTRSKTTALTTSLPQVMWHLANGWYNGTWNSLMSVLTCQWGNGSHVLFTDWMSRAHAHPVQLCLSSRYPLQRVPCHRIGRDHTVQKNMRANPVNNPVTVPPIVVLFHGCDAPRFKYLAMGWNLLATDHA